MPFQDLLNQPLPSQMENDYMTEAANPAKIAADVMDLNKTYKASIKEKKSSIRAIKILMKSKKFNNALNIINDCRKDVINDRNEISKRIKAIESAGLNKNTIRAITAGTAIVGGAKIAYDTNKSTRLKKSMDENEKKYRALVKKTNKAYESLDIGDFSGPDKKKEYDKAHQKITDEYDKGKDDLDNKGNEIYAKQTNHMRKSILSNTALAAGGGITYAVIKTFMLIKNNYEKYYDGVQKTLDKLEDKCEKQSQNIKECLIDFIMLTQDMEMLMESVDDYSNETFTEKGTWSEEFSALEKKFISLLDDCDRKLKTASSGASINAFIKDEESLFVSFIKSTEDMNLDEVTDSDFVSSDHIVYVYKKCITYLKKVVNHCISIAKKQNDATLYNKLEEQKSQIDKEQESIIDRGCKENIKSNEAITSLNKISNEIKSIASKISDTKDVSESTNSGKVERRMSFSDLLNQPLPSKLYLEAEEDDDKYISDGDAYEDGEVRQQGPTNTEECGDNCKGGCGDPEDVTESVDLKDKKKIKQAVKDITNLSKAYQKSTKEIRESIKGIRVQIALKKFNSALNMINTCRKKVLADRKEIEKQINSIKSAGFDPESIKKAGKESAKKSAGKILGTAGATAIGVKAIEYLDKDSPNVAHSTKGANSTNRILGAAALGTMAAGAATGYAIAAMGPGKFNNLYKLLKKVIDSYDEYYNTVLATLDSLENKCEDQSQNIKECLVDYITLSNSIEMLMESADDDDEDDINDDEEDIDDDEEEDEDDIDISGMSDADLDELEEELADSDVEDAVDDVEEVDLTPEEEREADDFMSLAATTELVRDELSATERAEFYADPVQAQIAVVEGFMLESDFSDGQMVTEKFFNKTRVQFSKEDRKHQLFAVALNASARAHNDPDYIKLQKVQQMRRVLKARIRKKYRGEALRRVKVYMQRLKASKSGVLAKIGAKLHKDSKD